MGSWSQTIVIGRLGQDPETQNGICKFSVATDYVKKDGGKNTEWHRIVTFGKLAEMCQRYLAKGRNVHCVGRNKTGHWEKDGIKRQRTEVECSTVTFLDPPSKENNQKSNEDVF